MPQLLFGFLLALIIAFLAYRAHSLSRSGAYAAVLIGTLIFGLGGWQWAIILLTFFISSSALTRSFRKRKLALNEKFEKSGQRDAAQVLANGAVASLFAGLHFFFPQANWPWLAFAASMAAVNADTWATELGVLNPTPPRLITNGKAVDRGTSGAISLYGTLSALAGAALVAILAAALSPYNNPSLITYYFLLITLAGITGALFDSLLGASVQAIYRCPQCDKETERHPIHTCGAQTTQIRGWKRLNNDMVNLACALMGVVVMMLLIAAYYSASLCLLP
ncbi:MAG: DUF92 domain-containing protein [Anaerolineales bacterium]|nr:DUF92 domain-containing protein [Anaerolineales bacterium]